MDGALEVEKLKTVPSHVVIHSEKRLLRGCLKERNGMYGILTGRLSSPRDDLVEEQR